MGANKVTYGRYKNNMMIMFLALALIFIDNTFSGSSVELVGK